MRSLTTIFLLGTSFSVLAGSALAEDLQGTVVSVGSAMNTTVMLTQPTDPKGPTLCYTDVTKRVRKLSAMTVKVSGAWTTNQKGEKTCFEVTDFDVLKTSSGRDAVVGTLGESGGAYQVTGKDGKVMTLGEITGGLKKLKGQKVILDLKSMNSPAAKEPTYKVVTYAAYP